MAHVHHAISTLSLRFGVLMGESGATHVVNDVWNGDFVDTWMGEGSCLNEGDPAVHCVGRNWNPQPSSIHILMLLDLFITHLSGNVPCVPSSEPSNTWCDQNTHQPAAQYTRYHEKSVAPSLQLVTKCHGTVDLRRQLDDVDCVSECSFTCSNEAYFGWNTLLMLSPPFPYCWYCWYCWSTCTSV